MPISVEEVAVIQVRYDRVPQNHINLTQAIIDNVNNILFTNLNKLYIDLLVK